MYLNYFKPILIPEDIISVTSPWSEKKLHNTVKPAISAN